MFQYEAFCYQLQLFEAESRIADEVLSRMEVNTTPVRSFRRPQRLQRKPWKQDTQVITDDGQDSLSAAASNASGLRHNSLHESNSLLTSSLDSSEKRKFYLSGVAFSTKDPVTACFDSVYSNVNSCTAEMSWRKPERLKKKSFLTAPCVSFSSADDFLSPLGKECFTVPNNDATENVDPEEEAAVKDCGHKPARNAVNGKKTKHGYSLRSKKNMESSSEDRSESSLETRLTFSTTVSLNAPPVRVNSPESSTLDLQASASQKTCGSRKRLQSEKDEETAENSRSESGTGREEDDSTTTRSDCRGYFLRKKRQKRMHNEKETAEPKNSKRCQRNSSVEEGTVNTGGYTLRQAQKDQATGARKDQTTGARKDQTAGARKDQTTGAHKDQTTGARKDQTTTELASLLHQCAPMTGGRMIRHRLRHHRRRVISKKTNLLCSSCVHGLLRTECLLCASVKSVTHMIVQKAAKRLNTGRKPTTPVVHQGTRKLLQDRTNQQGQRPVLSKVSKQNSILPPANLSCSHKKSSRIKETKPCSATTQNTAAKTTSKKCKNHSKLLKRKKSRDTSLTKTNNVQLNKNSSVTKKRKLGKSTSSKEPFSSARKRRKLSDSNRDKKVEAQGNVATSFMESSAIYHKHVSAHAVITSPSFTSAKDVFSQLCQLEERSKDYDLNTLQTIMPLGEQRGEGCRDRLSKTVSVYSRKSHIGGVWKAILS